MGEADADNGSRGGVAVDPESLKEPLLFSSNISASEENRSASTEAEDDKHARRAAIIALVRKIAGETIASFMVIFTLCAVRVNTDGAGIMATLATSLIGGLVVMVTIFSLGHVSGSHINPAVTIAYGAIRHFPLYLVPLYISAHILGATVAAFLLELIYRPTAGFLLVTPNSTILQSVLAETMAGFLLLFVASSVSTDTRAIGEFAGLAVGAIIAIDIMLVGPISGGGINPARALGPAIVSWNFTHVWIYVVGPIAGGLLGTGLYRLLRPEEARKRVISEQNKVTVSTRRLSLRRT